MRRDVSALDVQPREGRSESAEPSPKTDQGAICIQWVRCGKAGCRCMQGGAKHGPYYTRYWWIDGRRYKSYVRLEDAVGVGAACAERRAAERTERRQADASHQAWQDVLSLIRGIEHGER